MEGDIVRKHTIHGVSLYKDSFHPTMGGMKEECTPRELGPIIYDSYALY